MELRAVLLYPGVYLLMGLYDTGTQAYPFAGAPGPLSVVAQQGGLLASRSNGGITYNSTNHDPFEA